MQTYIGQVTCTCVLESITYFPVYSLLSSLLKAVSCIQLFFVFLTLIALFLMFACIHIHTIL